MDYPANIIEKFKFSYHETVKEQRKQERTPFIIYEPLRFTHSNMQGRDRYYKIVDVP